MYSESHVSGALWVLTGFSVEMYRGCGLGEVASLYEIFVSHSKNCADRITIKCRVLPRGSGAQGPGTLGPGARGPGTLGPGAQGSGTLGPGARGSAFQKPRIELGGFDKIKTLRIFGTTHLKG